MKRKVSAVILTILLLLILCFLIGLCVYGITSLVTAVINYLPTLYEEFLFGVTTLENNTNVLNFLPADMVKFIHSLTSDISYFVSELLSTIAKPTLSFSLNAVKSVPSLFIQIIVFVLAAIWMTMDYHKILLLLTKLLPKSVIRYFIFVETDMKKIILTWFVAQLKIMLVVFAVLVASFWILKVKSSILIAFITAFLDMLPAFGVGFIMWPWTAYEFIVGNYLFGAELVIVYLATQFVRNTLQPKIMGDSMGLSPLLTLVFMFVGFRVWGIAGMIFAVPIGMFVMSTIRYGVFDNFVTSWKIVSRDIGKILKDKLK